MIHRAIFGSFERFLGVLIEHTAGNLPFWLAPVQLVIMPITDKQDDYAKSVYDKFKKDDYRVELDLRNEKVGYKIREWETKKVPYMIILGEKEKTSGNISVRAHKKGDLGSFAPAEFSAKIEEENKY
jgi:threonyl-tRNA synthetase